MTGTYSVDKGEMFPMRGTQVKSIKFHFWSLMLRFYAGTLYRCLERYSTCLGSLSVKDRLGRASSLLAFFLCVRYEIIRIREFICAYLV